MTNDCYQLKRQLEFALESGKLDHLLKDVRKRDGRGRDPHRRNERGKAKVIDIVRSLLNNKKRRLEEPEEE